MWCFGAEREPGVTEKAEIIRKAMYEAGLSEKAVGHFQQDQLVLLYDGGYQHAYRIKHASRKYLEMCRLRPETVDVLLGM